MHASSVKFSFQVVISQQTV